MPNVTYALYETSASTSTGCLFVFFNSDDANSAQPFIPEGTLRFTWTDIPMKKKLGKWLEKKIRYR